MNRENINLILFNPGVVFTINCQTTLQNICTFSIGYCLKVYFEKIFSTVDYRSQRMELMPLMCLEYIKKNNLIYLLCFHLLPFCPIYYRSGVIKLGILMNLQDSNTFIFVPSRLQPFIFGGLREVKHALWMQQ